MESTIWLYHKEQAKALWCSVKHFNHRTTTSWIIWFCVCCNSLMVFFVHLFRIFFLKLQHAGCEKLPKLLFDSSNHLHHSYRATATAIYHWRKGKDFFYNYCSMEHYCKTINIDIAERTILIFGFVNTGFPPYLENMEFCHLLSRPRKCLEFAQKFQKPGILTQNLEKYLEIWTFYVSRITFQDDFTK